MNRLQKLFTVLLLIINVCVIEKNWASDKDEAEKEETEKIGANGLIKQFNFQFENAEVDEVVKIFARETKQKFVIDSGLKAKVSIFSSSPVTAEEACHLLSKSLATKGIGLLRHGELWIVKQAKLLQKDMLPVVTSLPDPIPERMLNFVVTLKYINADLFNRKMKSLLSKEGVVNAVAENKIIITDWVSNLFQIQALLNEIDKEDTKLNSKIK
jgi:general secretion pathway protein D